LREERERERVGFILGLISSGILVLRSRGRGITSALQISGAGYSYAPRRYEVFMDYYLSLDPFVLEPQPRAVGSSLAWQRCREREESRRAQGGRKLETVDQRVNGLDQIRAWAFLSRGCRIERPGWIVELCNTYF
jgi:hypothetical protein